MSWNSPQLSYRAMSLSSQDAFSFHLRQFYLEQNLTRCSFVDWKEFGSQRACETSLDWLYCRHRTFQVVSNQKLTFTSLGIFSRKYEKSACLFACHQQLPLQSRCLSIYTFHRFVWSLIGRTILDKLELGISRHYLLFSTLRNLLLYHWYLFSIFKVPLRYYHRIPM